MKGVYAKGVERRGQPVKRADGVYAEGVERMGEPVKVVQGGVLKRGGEEGGACKKGW